MFTATRHNCKSPVNTVNSYPYFPVNDGFARRSHYSTQIGWCRVYQGKVVCSCLCINIWAPSSEFVSSSILSWQILTAHAQTFRGARYLAFCLKVPLDSLLVWASSEGSGETARMRRLAWTFAARIGDKYQIRLTRSILSCLSAVPSIIPY